MNSFSILKCLVYVCLLTTLFACQDHQVPVGTQRYRLKKTVNSTSVSPTYTTVYTYNSAGKLSSFEGTSSDRYVLTTLHYDTQNRLTDIEESSRTAVTGRAVYAYDSRGNVATITKYTDDPNKPAGNLAIKQTTTLDYGSGKLPEKATLSVDGTSTQQVVYNYANGNVVRIDYLTSPGGQPVSSTTFAYDNKPNPYAGLPEFRQDLSALINTINTNNFYNDPANPLLEYDSNGLLSKRSGSRVSAQVTYEYESY